MNGVYRFFRSIALIIALFLIMAFIAVTAYDKGYYRFSSPASDTLDEKNIQFTYHTSASSASEKQPASNPVLETRPEKTESPQVHMDNIFAGLPLSHPITASHMEKLRSLLLAKKFIYDEIDLWIEKAMPEASDREAEMVYVRIVKLRQKAMQK